MHETTVNKRNGIQWSISSQLDDLDFADDLAHLSHTIVNRTNWLGNSASFFVIDFCSLFPLFVGLDRAQNTKGFQMHMNN